MTEDPIQTRQSDDDLVKVGTEIASAKTSRARRLTEKFVIAALGSIPWVGGFIAAGAEIRRDEGAVRSDDLRTRWLEEHQRKLTVLQRDLGAISMRLAELGDEIEDRVQSPEYLALVRQAFRAWDKAETDDKRQFITNLLTNSAGTRVCSDDVVRLFISWLDLYDEVHFAVIREIHQHPGSTRYEIWAAIYGGFPRDDSAEADLYRMLIRDLSTGGVIRQARDKTGTGDFLRHQRPKSRGRAPSTMKSAFDDVDKYVLTELGKQFVHYTLMGHIRRLQDT